MAGLEFKHISKHFGAVVALNDISLTVEPGEIRALLGGNGSGKSTLARITAGTVAQSSGEVYLDGELLNIESPIASRKYGIAVTSQELSLFPSLTVAENLSLLNVPKKALIFDNKKVAREKAIEILKLVHLENKVDLKLAYLSDNEKYLVEFAKAILFQPKVLIVDEITSALRREEVKMVFGILKDMAAKGCCILFISHRMQELFDICTSVTVLRNGEYITTRQIKDTSDRQLITDMIGSDPFENREGGVVETNLDTPVVLSVKDLKLPQFADGNISFDLHEGEVLAIAGLQGQGQSDLLRCLYGMRAPLPVKYKGEDYVISSPEAAIRKGIGFLSGDRVTEGVFVGRSIGENCEVINNLVLKRPKLERDEVLKNNNVKYDTADKPIETLSGGNQQKVVISRLTSVIPDVLLADDPTKGIDVAARFDVHDMMDDMAAKGTAVLFASSDDEELASMALNVRNFSVMVMYEGNVVARLYGKDITVPNIIAASMPNKKGGEA